MKKLLIFVCLLFFTCYANAHGIWQNDEQPFATVIEQVKPIDESAKELVFPSQTTLYLNELYNVKNTYVDKNFYSVYLPDEENSKLTIGKLLYDGDLNLLVAGDGSMTNWLDGGSKFKRFYMVYNAEGDKYGIYDTKRNKFTGFKYNVEDINVGFSGVPTVKIDGKKISLQPYKRVGNAIARGSFKTGKIIILTPVMIIYGPILLVAFYKYVTD